MSEQVTPLPEQPDAHQEPAQHGLRERFLHAYDKAKVVGAIALSAVAITGPLASGAEADVVKGSAPSNIETSHSDSYKTRAKIFAAKQKHQHGSHHAPRHRGKIPTPHKGKRGPAKGKSWSDSYRPPLVETPQFSELIDLHPETLGLSSEDAKFIEENVVIIPESGCSGLLVRDPKTNKAIGYMSSTHCGALKQNGKRSTAADGSPIFKSNNPVIAYTGNRADSLTAVGGASEIFYAADDDMTNDQMYVAFKGSGYSAEQVMGLANQASPERARQYKKGDVLSVGFWPASQPENQSGQNERQDTPVVVMGYETWTISNGEKIEVVVTAIPKKSNCTPGASGSYAFGRENGVPMTVGGASGYVTFDTRLNPYGAQAARDAKRSAENKYGVKMDEFSGLCAFAVQQPKRENGAIAAKIVIPESPTWEIPHQDEIKQDVEDFSNPNVDKVFFEGYMHLPGGKDDFWVHNPVMFHHKSDGSYALGYSTSSNGGDLIVVPFDKPEDFEFYSSEPDGSVAQYHFQEPPAFTRDADGTFGGYTYTDKILFGEVMKNNPSQAGARQKISFEDGSWIVQPAR